MNRRERVIAALHGAYKYAISPVLHAAAGTTGACRFQPTCSEYAAIAVSEYGFVRAVGWPSGDSCAANRSARAASTR